LEDLTNIAQTRKILNQATAERIVAYPYEALEEAIANAAYHRGYDNIEPNKIYLYPDRMEITSYPGPVPGLNLQHLGSNSTIPPFPARNRRIGEMLKEIKLAEMRGTGIPKIRRTMAQMAPQHLGLTLMKPDLFSCHTSCSSKVCCYSCN
jgi:ATP-dependent DNA helicase RecG